jgi:hypothetical protein
VATHSRIILIIPFLFCGCALFKSGGSEKWNRGEWADHAQNAWNVMSANLQKSQIQFSKPSKLETKFVAAHGVLGTGANRYPYIIENGQKIGGWHIGNCNGAGSATVVREAGGFWNANVGTHEVGHHLNTHARCDPANGWHPDYIRKAGAPYWPNYSAKVMLLNYEFDDASVCVLVLSDGISAMSDVREKLEDFAAKIYSEK